jgi:hypothetical protein
VQTCCSCFNNIKCKTETQEQKYNAIIYLKKLLLPAGGPGIGCLPSFKAFLISAAFHVAYLCLCSNCKRNSKNHYQIITGEQQRRDKTHENAKQNNSKFREAEMQQKIMVSKFRDRTEFVGRVVLPTSNGTAYPKIAFTTK